MFKLIKIFHGLGKEVSKLLNVSSFPQAALGTTISVLFLHDVWKNKDTSEQFQMGLES